MIPRILSVGLAVTCANALPRAAFKRHISELRPTYDVVICGGGTAGLTVADRLTEAFPESKSSQSSTRHFWLTFIAETVLVVEYGEVAYAPGAFDPPSLVWGGPTDKAGYFTFNSVPNPEMNGKQALLFVGQTVGGSSAINGQYFDRGSRHDYDAWTQIGGPEFANSTAKWDWESLFPYFKKVSTVAARV